MYSHNILSWPKVLLVHSDLWQLALFSLSLHQILLQSKIEWPEMLDCLYLPYYSPIHNLIRMLVPENESLNTNIRTTDTPMTKATKAMIIRRHPALSVNDLRIAYLQDSLVTFT